MDEKQIIHMARNIVAPFPLFQGSVIEEDVADFQIAVDQLRVFVECMPYVYRDVSKKTSWKSLVQKLTGERVDQDVFLVGDRDVIQSFLFLFGSWSYVSGSLLCSTDVPPYRFIPALLQDISKDIEVNIQEGSISLQVKTIEH